jgi:putative transposase
LGLQLRNKSPKRRVKAKLREDRCEATRANETWAMDFVHDQLATGKKLRVLTIVDTFSRFSPVVDPRFSYRGEDVVATLERVCADVGFPKTIRVDQGSEFVSRDLDLWAYRHGVVLDFSRPGKPTDNAFIEAFNGRFRAGVPVGALVPEPCRRPRKDGGLAQVLQRGPTPRRDRVQGPDIAHRTRRRCRPAVVTKPGISGTGRSKVRVRCKDWTA